MKQKWSVAATDSKYSEHGDFINLAKEIRSNPPSLNPPLFCVCEVELNVLDLFTTGGYRITTVLMFINILPPKKKEITSCVKEILALLMWLVERQNIPTDAELTFFFHT